MNNPDLFTANYQRFLMNRFREKLPFPEVPIKLVIRGRKRHEAFDDDNQVTRIGERRMSEADLLADFSNNPDDYFDTLDISDEDDA